MYNHSNHFADGLKYILYVRKSTDSSDKQVQSLDDQIRVMSELASRRDLNIVETIVESRSAKMPNSREGFAKMIEIIERGEANGILSYAFDRLSRNPVDSASVKWLLQTNKIKRIVTASRDYLPEDNALLLSIEDGMANEYIRKLKRDIRRGMVSKFNKGIYPSMAPIGYYNCPYDRDIKPDKLYFRKIRKMWDMALSGKYSIPQIHQIVVEEWNLITPKKKKLGGTPISRSLVYKIFHNRFYTGEILWDGMTNKGIHKPMVTIKEFDAVQKMIKTKPIIKASKFNHAYGGLIRCGVCGCQITPECQVRKDRKYTYYHCTGRAKYKPCDQIKCRLREEEIGKQILNKIGVLEIDKAFYDLAIDYIENQSKNLNINNIDQKKDYEKQLSRINLRKAKLTELLIEELLEKDEYRERLENLKKEITRLKLKIDGLKIQKPIDYERLKTKFSSILDITDIFHDLKNCKKRELLENIAIGLSLKDKKLDIDLCPTLKLVKKFNEKHSSKKPYSKNTLVKPNNNSTKAQAHFCEKKSRWCNLIKEVCKIYREQSGY